MKRKYTEMVFHFFQEYFPGTRVYEGKLIKIKMLQFAILVRP